MVHNMEAKKTAILALDIGGVCIHVELQRFHGGLGFPEAPPWLRELGLRHNLGQLTSEEYFARVLQGLPEPRPTPGRLRELFGALLVAPNPGMRELIASLPGRGIRPVFFSDINRPHVERALRLLEAEKIITDGVFSYEVGAFKPSAAMLEAFEARFGKPLLYVDDLPELVSGAKAHGWNAAVFQSATQVETLLRQLG